VARSSSFIGFGAPISDPARFSMFPLQAGSETGAPGGSAEIHPLDWAACKRDFAMRRKLVS